MAFIDLNEPEIQLLASLAKADGDKTSTDKASLEQSSERFWIYREDWHDAYGSLIKRGLINGDDQGYQLTDQGRPLAEDFNRQRPDYFWYYYQQFYAAALASAAHTQLCETVYGKDLCQEGMVDMAALEDLIAKLNINPGHHVLDLGCGVGVISEYISDITGCQVTGLDYSESAIELAKQRTADKAERLNFVWGDMNDLSLADKSFDIVISLDTFYWVDDLQDMLAKVVKCLKPGGQMGIFMLDSGDFMLESGDSSKPLKAGETRAGKPLNSLDLKWQAYDYTEKNAEFWRKMHVTVNELKSDFEAEGNGFIAAGLLKDAEEDFLPVIEKGTLVRYLYHVEL